MSEKIDLDKAFDPNILNESNQDNDVSTDPNEFSSLEDYFAVRPDTDESSFQELNVARNTLKNDARTTFRANPIKSEGGMVSNTYHTTRGTDAANVIAAHGRSHDQAAESHYQDTMPTAYEDMTMPELARALAAAENQADITKAGDIQDTLVEKMVEFTEKNNLDNDAQENLWSRIMKVKDNESEKLGEKGEVESDKTKRKIETIDRKQQIRDEIMAIKKGMAERAKNGLDNVDYDVAFEDAQDDKVIDLLKEAYDTNDAEDPRIVKAVKELDDYEDKLVNDDPEVKAGKILRNISEGRHKNTGWSETDEEVQFLEFLDTLKKQFGTDNLDDPRIQDALNKATEKIKLDHEWLVAKEKSDNYSRASASLQEELAKIPDLEKSEDLPTKIVDNVEVGDLPLNPFERINQSKEYEGNSNLAMRAKIDVAKRMVAQGLSPGDALGSLVLASNSDLDKIVIQKFSDEGIDSPTEEQLKMHKEQLIDSLFKTLSTIPKKSPESKTYSKETSLSRGVDKGVDKLSKYVNRKTSRYIYKVEDFKNNPEKQKKYKIIAAGLGGVAISAATYFSFKYGIRNISELI